MKYMKLLAAFAMVSLMTGFAFAAQAGNGPSANEGNCIGNCGVNCPNEGNCNQENCQIGENCIKGDVAQDRDQERDRVRDPAQDGSCQQ
jgi:hypothetical protein